MKTMKNYLLPFMMLGILLLAVGCANSEERDNSSNSSEGSENESAENSQESQENIQTVLENIFTGPNEEQEKMLESNEDMAENLTEFREEKFKPYVTDDFYENDIVKLSGGVRFLLAAHPNYMLEVGEVTLDENEDKEGEYDFKVKVTFTNQEDEQSETMTVEGTASTNEEGKVKDIRYINDEEFRDALGE
ncbi:hypothetical protein [Pseudalkalibacillus hwajinpoensis]|uniref:hypothetical protein n=1 Tax=Guptibacillus hwajinpoensis TaxID=208199 RepID=UPI001CD6CC2A|nr:hypothetical protein [Pseudalkalibacillus hwajinpoensis]MCA0990714.1 hypothetical protein [Pseudalkalibacillus hwajinpoensis]